MTGTATLEEDDTVSGDLVDQHRHHHHGGFAMFIAISLDSLGTTPAEDAAIIKIQSDMNAKMQPAHDAEKSLLLTIADGTAQGSIDTVKVDAAIAELSLAAAKVHEAVAESVNQLHGVLTPPERAALVDKVEAHFDVWHGANSLEDPADKDARGGHLAILAKELGLSPAQVERIRANFKTKMAGAPPFDGAEGSARVKAFGAAFVSDTFDAKAFITDGPANARIAIWGATRMAHFYQAVAPELTSDERIKLADSLRRHANYKRTDTGT